MNHDFIEMGASVVFTLRLKIKQNHSFWANIKVLPEKRLLFFGYKPGYALCAPSI